MEISMNNKFRVLLSSKVLETKKTELLDISNQIIDKQLQSNDILIPSDWVNVDHFDWIVRTGCNVEKLHDNYWHTVRIDEYFLDSTASGFMLFLSSIVIGSSWLQKLKSHYRDKTFYIVITYDEEKRENNVTEWFFVRAQEEIDFISFFWKKLDIDDEKYPIMIIKY